MVRSARKLWSRLMLQNRNLGKYRCLFLPNVVSMSEASAKTIAEYVKRGGCLVATEDTGVLNEFLQPWKGERDRREKSHILGELLGFEWPEEETKFLEVNDGRVAIVGRVDRPDKAGGSISSDVQLSHSYGPEMPLYSFARELAVNHEEIVSALDYALCTLLCTVHSTAHCAFYFALYTLLRTVHSTVHCAL